MKNNSVVVNLILSIIGLIVVVLGCCEDGG
jgi:hypothetical protein